MHSIDAFLPQPLQPMECTLGLSNMASLDTYASTVNRYRQDYSRQLEARQISPFVVPTDAFGYGLVLVYWSYGQQLSRPLQMIILAVVIVMSTCTLLDTRTLRLAYGMLVGIGSAWCIALSIGFMLRCGSVSIEERTPDDLFHQRRRSIMGTSSRITGENLNRTYDVGRDIAKLLAIYLCMDCFKEIMVKDPYFWGSIDHRPPTDMSSLLPGAAAGQVYRMMLASVSLYLAIEFITTAGVLLLVRLPEQAIASTRPVRSFPNSPFGEIGIVGSRGLQGCWGSYWHQLFRPVLLPFADVVVHRFAIRDRAIARVLRLFVAFSVSGAIHAAGSHTMWGSSYPFNSFLFFLVQPVGINIQDSGCWILRWLGITDFCRPWVRKTSNLLFTAVWLLQTFPLLAEDLARGGLWLTEPFPVSVLQVMGLGGTMRFANKPGLCL